MVTNDVTYQQRRDAALETLVIAGCSLIPTTAQVPFLLDMSGEALYGGAAGAGKTVALLLAALQYVEIPGYRALILRRNLTELLTAGGIYELARQHLDTSVKWNAELSTFTFASGATLTFGHLADDNAKYRYQGLEYQYIGFDELTQFTKSQYTYLFSRLRKPSGDSPLAQVPLRMRAATNPGGTGHEWVYEHFILPWREQHPDAPRFFPANFTDNPHLDQDGYRNNLERLDPITRAQLLDGNWDIRSCGRMFQPEWFDVITPDQLPEQLQRVRYWDLAATAKTPTNDPDYTAGVLVGYHQKTKTYYVIDIQRFRDTPGNIERHIQHIAQRDGRDVKIYIEEEPGSSGKALIDHYRTNVLNGYTFRGDRPTGHKITRAEPIASRAEHHEIKLVSDAWNSAFLDEATLFPDGQHDDQIDALAGGISMIAQRPNYPIIIPPMLTRNSPWDIS